MNSKLIRESSTQKPVVNEPPSVGTLPDMSEDARSIGSVGSVSGKRGRGRRCWCFTIAFSGAFSIAFAGAFAGAFAFASAFAGAVLWPRRCASSPLLAHLPCRRPLLLQKGREGILQAGSLASSR
jgi:hypothetical protein